MSKVIKIADRFAKSPLNKLVELLGEEDESAVVATVVILHRKDGSVVFNATGDFVSLMMLGAMQMAEREIADQFGVGNT
jgi:hypothetical protein